MPAAKGDPQDHVEAVRWYRMAAEQGNSKAQEQLGFMYRFGLVSGVPRDDAESTKWYRMLAEQGDANAQFYLGWNYSKAEGVPQNYVESISWLRMGAEQGHTDAQHSLGLMYEKGQGVPQDYVQAHMWVNLAASGSVAVEREARARELLAQKMTPAQIAEAQRLAREWKPKTWDELKQGLETESR